QLRYRGHVINFLQNIQGFITRLPRDLATIDTLVVRRTGQDCSTFHDFKVKHANILVWLNFLRKNNPFYANIEIDHDILQTLPKDGSVFERLYAVHDVDSSVNDTVNLTNNSNISDIVNMSDNYITYTFVPNPVSKKTEEVATYN
ncbi:25455_t:CDS:1, partial [Racocetra persica]